MGINFISGGGDGQAAPRPRAVVNNNSDQTIPDTSFERITFNNVIFDDNGWFDGTADEFVVDADGRYRVTTQLEIEVLSGGLVSIRQHYGGLETRHDTDQGAGDYVPVNVNIFNLNDGDTIWLEMIQTTGLDVTVLSSLPERRKSTMTVEYLGTTP